ncbi:MAG: DUF6600 domain-containing protein [Pseudomonadota bacterium]
MIPFPRITAVCSALLFIFSLNAFAQEDELNGASPLRLSYTEGDVSFWRVGAPDWVDAQLNTPLATGDSLYVGSDGDLELQMGSRAFVRADDETQFSLINQTPDFIQFKVTSGRVSFDLRALPAGYSVEVDTPNAVFTIDHAGYYRVDVDGDVHFITRRGGMAMVVPAGGRAMSIHPSEEIVVQGTTVAKAETYVVPGLDQWDRWNYERTDDLIDTVSERYLPYGVAGASDLDHYGYWRMVPEYGPVWLPDSVPPGWVPYSAGSWVWDPYYQWTWIDEAPWGWTPFHYGRWVYLSGYWAWAPGPVIRQPVYAPALVVFFDIGPNVSAGISTPGVGWVALSWGEPLNPWWGRRSLAGRPWWGGWGGPRIEKNEYRNIRVNNSIVATSHDRFGNGRVHETPLQVKRPRELEHFRGALPVKPGPESLVAGARKGTRPPERMLTRQVVGTLPPRESNLPWTETSRREVKTIPEQRFVPIPKRSSSDLPRPEFGAQTGAERPRSPLPPRFEDRRRVTEPAVTGNMRERAGTGQAAPMAPRSIPFGSPPAERNSSPRVVPVEPRQQERADLPGKPANRVYRTKEQDEEKGKRQRSEQNPEGFNDPRQGRKRE